MSSLVDKLIENIVKWLTHEEAPTGMPVCDFERIQYEIRPCDVLLIEGRSRVSNIIKNITLSPWSHSALYIGRLHDIDNPILRARVLENYHGDENSQLVIESYLGKGTIVSPIDIYKHDHIRICRPRGLSRRDAQQVIGYSIGRIGLEYDIRQILDLARLLIPWTVIPRRWRSSLFRSNTGTPTRQICSAAIAEAFSSVRFPILPYVKRHSSKDGIELIPRNPRLTTPSDFDYSPYFGIIKYPLFELDEMPAYRNLPWNEEGVLSNDNGDLMMPDQPTTDNETKTSSTKDKVSILQTSSQKKNKRDDGKGLDNYVIG